MILGVSSYAFGWAVGVRGFPPPVPFTATDLIRFARSRGLRLVQFGDHLPIELLSVQQFAELRHEAFAGGPPISIETGSRGLTESSLKRSIAMSHALDSRLLRFVIDGPGHEPEPSEVIALLRAAMPLLKEANVTLGLENHDRFPARTLRQMLEKIGSSDIGICLDTANSLGAGEGLEYVLDQLGPHTVNLHLKDFMITRVPHAMGFTIEGRPAGKGALNIPELLEKLARFGRCRTAVLETWTPPERSLAETIIKERHWTEDGLDYLQPLFSAA